MELNDVKKQLYKEKPEAKFSHAGKGGLLYYCLLFAGTKMIYFEIPFSDIGDASFLAIMPAQQLIRWIIFPKQ